MIYNGWSFARPANAKELQSTVCSVLACTDILDRKKGAHTEDVCPFPRTLKSLENSYYSFISKDVF